ncbi:hypothetical protein ABH926_008819 [Catenulispora sp. GP43]|uniref:hypothetical protein n=1 Tax=Catenulispora sp. GP43 TaxID=3156263 RepID=UPI00351830A3
MVRTTPPRPLDVLATIPGLVDFARTTTRLHPRRGTPSATDSSIGGPLLWPADEPWPICTAPYRDQRHLPVDEAFATTYLDARKARLRRETLTPEQEAVLDDPRVNDGNVSVRCTNGEWELRWHESTGHTTPNALIPIAQLYAADAPTITFPTGRDLLQILWCPLDHTNIPGQRYYAGPPVHLFWRTAADIGAVLADPPGPHAFDDRFYLPTACVLHPEQVLEYQYCDLLPDGLREQVREADEDWEDEYDLRYQYDLSIAPGCKAGGWASWHLTDPWGQTCSTCDADFDLLVGFDSSEWDGIVSWKPVEDDADDRDAQCPTGLTHGRWGEMRIFVCSADVTHPFQLNIQ